LHRSLILSNNTLFIFFQYCLFNKFQLILGKIVHNEATMKRDAEAGILGQVRKERLPVVAETGVDTLTP
jgi:hypothetical protein